METEKKIIKLFIEEKQPFTIREISKKIKSDYKITYTAVKRLLEKEILASKVIGKSILCELNNNYFGTMLYEVENDRKKSLLKNKNLKQLYQELMSKIDSSFFILVVFGSYAKNLNTKSSDIDFLFVSNEKDFEEKITNIFSLIPLKTHFLVLTQEDFIRMKDSKKSNVVKEIIKNNVILFGIENYYRLKNAN
ncbi:protein containing Nucleotidyltransferase domain [sediment metagenome]|uniref:Protein containing Nucleotidyltransferase domain n=1 Tax=sediment metagenome TaxID=749907 RepID=D9PJC4_9ZZZZ